MKYVITGAAGNISKPLTEKLLAAGHSVTVIGRSAKNLEPLTLKGATAAIGSLEDVAFLTETFTGANAVYAMVPPNPAAENWKEYMGQIGENYAAPIKASGVKYVVVLSSIGAHMPDGCGPVSGLYRVEEVLKNLPGVAVKFLRPGYFYTNFYGNVGMIKGMNILGGNYGGADAVMTLADPDDIADAAAEELQSLAFSGYSIRYVVSDERTTGDIAKVLGTAVGKPALPWISFTDEDTYNAMKGAGMPEEVARNYAEMGSAMRSGAMMEEYQSSGPVAQGKTRLEDFAKAFAGAYHAA